MIYNIHPNPLYNTKDVIMRPSFSDIFSVYMLLFMPAFFHRNCKTQMFADFSVDTFLQDRFVTV